VEEQDKIKINSWYEYLDADTIRKESPKYKDARLALAHRIKKHLNQSPFADRWFLDGGTLLGVWRNSSIIDHDYDFDFGLHGTLEELQNLEAILVGAFKNEPQMLIKSENSYATKLMVIDQSYGQFESMIEWWKVYADIQLYSLDKYNPQITRMQYFKDDFLEREYRTEWFKTMKEVLLKDDGENWPVPIGDVEVLKTTYGYLGENAQFDPKTKLYVKAD
jgi:hypothetical protein